MVQEKDAAKKRSKDREDFLAREREKYEKSIIKTVWFVVETTPAYNTGGYYDTDVEEVNIGVSPDCDSAEEAREWMDRHEPDEGKYLRVAKSHLRKITYNTWTGPIYERNNS